VRGWLTPTPDPEFESKCAEVCTLYHEAPAAARRDVRTVSVDEMTRRAGVGARRPRPTG
jgi:hypothetical protein